MSSFFRSAADSNSSASDDSSSDSERSNGAAGGALTSDKVQNIDSAFADGQNAGLVPYTESSINHRDLLLHALLEERSGNEQEYQQLCNHLAAYGLVSPNYNDERHRETRQHYRDGLDLLTGSRPAAGSAGRAVPAPLRKLIAGTNDRMLLQMPGNSQESNLFPVEMGGPGPGLPAHPLLAVSQYKRAFEELGMLGKGGYGVVYHVKHRLDGLPYAVKKIPLSSSRLQRIEQNRQSELDGLLLELRTIARLDHPNVVRYHNGWIEWTTNAVSQSLEPDVVLSAEDNRSGSFPVTDEPSDHFGAPGGIVFDDSSAEADTGRDGGIVFGDESDAITDVDDAHMSSRDNAVGFSEHSTSANTSLPSKHRLLSRISTRSTIATVSDDEVESITRTDFPTSTGAIPDSAGTNGEIVSHAGPVLALHIQMALHPMTLADFLSPTARSGPESAIPLQHCFHVGPSMDIISAIIDGTEYLHSEGIVHRDLKPGNIFMSANNSRSRNGSVDLFLCSQCRQQGSANPLALDVRIGDFGLVTTIAQPEESVSAAAKPVGTEIYRPTVATPGSISQDIFALGIIMFELLWRFNTRKLILQFHSIRAIAKSFRQAWNDTKYCKISEKASFRLSFPKPYMMKEVVSKL